MARKPNLSKIDEMFVKGNDFELTDDKYEKLTGCPLPKDKNYLSKGSAIARHAHENGFEITVIEKKIILVKKG